MLNKIFTLSFLFLSLSNLLAQDIEKPELLYSNQINTDSLKSYLYYLASDELEGRETGKEGQKLAANYLAEKYINYQLKPLLHNKDSYFQEFKLLNKDFKNSNFIVNNDTLILKDDYFFFPKFDFLDISSDEILFLGYGIDDENYSDLPKDKSIIKDKIVVVLEGEPKKGKKFLINNSKEKSEWGENENKKLALFTDLGAKALFVVAENYERRSRIIRYIVERPRLYLEDDSKPSELLPLYYMHPKFLENYLAIDYDKKLNKKVIKNKLNKEKVFPLKVQLHLDFNTDEVFTENVAAFIPGKTDEYIIISSHFDHLGKDEEGNIYNGADDNASGTSSVLELSRVFMQAYKDGFKPEKNLIFMNVSGEEKGLLGSDYYTRNPIVPLEKTMTNLNIDMVGRNDKNYSENDEYIYLIGSDKISKKLHDISETANKEFSNLTLDYTFNDENDPNRFYYRSDHYNFAKNNIPVIFYFSGVHKDYHKPEDTAEKINYELLTKRTRLVFHTAWKLAYTKDLKLD